MKDGKGVGQRPEGGHGYQTENDIPAPKKGGVQPEKMGNEEAGAEPVCVMELPSRV